MSNEAAVIEEIQKRLDALEARRIAGPRGPAGDIQAAVDNAERVAKAIVIERLDSYVQRTEAIAARIQKQLTAPTEASAASFRTSSRAQLLRDCAMLLRTKWLRSF
jgi:hypothetical protein